MKMAKRKYTETYREMFSACQDPERGHRPAKASDLKLTAGRSPRIEWSRPGLESDPTYRKLWKHATGSDLRKVIERIYLDVFDGVLVPLGTEIKVTFADIASMQGNASFTKWSGRFGDGAYRPRPDSYRIRLNFVHMDENLWKVVNTAVHEFVHVRQMVTRELRCGPGFDYWRDCYFEQGITAWEDRPWEVDAVRVEALLSPKHCRSIGLTPKRSWTAKRCLKLADRVMAGAAVAGHNFRASTVFDKNRPENDDWF